MTITTVGYGDYYPGHHARASDRRVVMFAGVGIIGALASILASVLVPPVDLGDESDAAPRLRALRPVTAASIPTSTIEAELAGLRAEMAALRLALAPEPPAAPG